MNSGELIDFDDIQGLVVRGYGELPHAAYLLFRISSAKPARKLLGRIARGITYARSKPETGALNLALTYPGLEALGVGEETLAGFSDAFRAGMNTAHKNRILGDEGASSPSNWAWGGPQTAEVHGVFLVFAWQAEALEHQLRSLEQELAGKAVAVIDRLSSHAMEVAREHFGFRDAIGQPFIAEFDRLGRERASPVPLGEFLLGYKNGYGRYTQRPQVAAKADPGNHLATDPDDKGLKDLGLNGTYLVFRQLAQDVRAFWQTMQAKGSGGRGEGGGNADAFGAIRLASKLVGRWPSGTPLVLAPEADPEEQAEPDRFAYHELDAKGLRCPLGAHIRRTNPRDSLPPKPGSEQSEAFSNRHRLLRRGRIYGAPFHPDFSPEAFLQHLDAEDHGSERGLHFICLSANIQRQFEFVQHTWANNPTFNGLYDDPDPLVGPRVAHGRNRDTFTEQREPVRCRYPGLPEFVRTRGGAYFFLPSRRALEYLTSPAA